MSLQCGGAQPQIPFENGPRRAQTATGTPFSVADGTVPISVCVRTPWGVVELPCTTFAVMPGKGNVVLCGKANVKELGIDSYPLA